MKANHNRELGIISAIGVLLAEAKQKNESKSQQEVLQGSTRRKVLLAEAKAKK